jgi:hypothetical protein
MHICYSDRKVRMLINNFQEYTAEELEDRCRRLCSNGKRLTLEIQPYSYVPITNECMLAFACIIAVQFHNSTVDLEGLVDPEEEVVDSELEESSDDSDCHKFIPMVPHRCTALPPPCMRRLLPVPYSPR